MNRIPADQRRALLVQHHAPRDGASNVNDI